MGRQDSNSEKEREPLQQATAAGVANGKEGLVEVEAAGAQDIFKPPDGGWGWVVCFASFWTNGCIFGILNCYGVMFMEVLTEFGREGQDNNFLASWVGSIFIGSNFLISPIASILADRLGIRKTAFVGGAIAFVGMLSSSFVTRIEHLFLTYGACMGIGTSLVYTPSLAILGHYFSRHLGLVNGLVSFGSAVFTMVLPFAMKVSLDVLGLRNTMRILSGMMATLMICAVIWKPLIPVAHTELDHYLSGEIVPNRAKGVATWIKKYLNLSIWKNKSYVVWVIGVPVALFGYFVPFVHLVKHVSDILPGVNGGILVMCIGATSGVGRLIFGKVADCPGMNRVRMQQCSFALLGALTACIPLAKNFGGLIAITLLMGLSDGCFVCLLGPIAFDLLGPQGATQGLGFLFGIMSIPMTVGPPVAGFVYDYLGSYDIAFYAAGAPPILGALIMFLVPRAVKQTLPRVTTAEAMAALSCENLDKLYEWDPTKDPELVEERMPSFGVWHRPIRGANNNDGRFWMSHGDVMLTKRVDTNSFIVKRSKSASDLHNILEEKPDIATENV